MLAESPRIQADWMQPEHSPPSPGGDRSAPCAVCGKDTVLCCSGCESVFYCSEEHQHSHWPTHKKQCRKPPPGGLASAVQTPMISPVQTVATPPRAFSPHVGFGHPSPAVTQPAPGPAPMSMSMGEIEASRQVMASSRARRVQLRASAVLAAREGRHKDAMLFAAEAFEVAQHILRAEGMEDSGDPEAESAILVETLIICRAAAMEGNLSVGLSFLQTLLKATDRLAGTLDAAPIFEPCSAATLLLSVSEICMLYEQHDNAEDYAHAYLATARVAHGEGSPAVGDAHAFLAGLLTKWGRFEEALQHANILLQIRQRSTKKGHEKFVAEAHWNVGVLKHQVGDHEGSLNSIRACRDLRFRAYGEGADTAEADVAIGKLHRAVGNYKAAVRVFRVAYGVWMRVHGFAHEKTRAVASLLDATVLDMKQELEYHLETDEGDVMRGTR